MSVLPHTVRRFFPLEIHSDWEAIQDQKMMLHKIFVQRRYILGQLLGI